MSAGTKVQLEPPESADRATKKQRWLRLCEHAARIGYRVVVADHLRGLPFALMDQKAGVVYVSPTLLPDGEPPN